MALPQPVTRSPGKLSIVYTMGALTHSAGAHLVSGVSIGDIASLRIEAVAMATAAQPLLYTAGNIQGWRVSNELGETVYEESFPVPFGGTWAGGGGSVSESNSQGYVGKGVATTVGLKSGVTRTTFFVGAIDTSAELAARTPITEADARFGPMLLLLNSSATIGADFYGQKASYKNYINNQINAHYQKRYGI